MSNNNDSLLFERNTELEATAQDGLITGQTNQKITTAYSPSPSFLEALKEDIALTKELQAQEDEAFMKEIEKSPSVGLKFDQEKPDMSLLSSVAIEQIAQVLSFGKKKYAAHNWRKGIAHSRLLGALLRHTFAYLKGEDKDPESGLSHLAHAGCCIMFLLETSVTRPDLDDRYKGEKNATEPAD